MITKEIKRWPRTDIHKDTQPQDVQWRETQRQTEHKDMQSHHRVMMRLKRARNKIKHAIQSQTTIRCRSMTCNSLNTVCQEREAKWVQMFLKNKMTTDQLHRHKNQQMQLMVKRDAKQAPRDSHKMTRDLKQLQRFKISCDTLQPQRDDHRDAK